MVIDEFDGEIIGGESSSFYPQSPARALHTIQVRSGLEHGYQRPKRGIVTGEIRVALFDGPQLALSGALAIGVFVGGI